MSLSSWLMYLGVVLLSTLSPGPAVLLSMSNAVAHGPRAAAWSSLGNVASLMLLSIATMLGVGAVIRSSAMAFGILKALGAAYLIYLGIRKWRSGTAPLDPDPARGPATGAAHGGWQLFAQGALLALTNPKAILFFTALFPQFISANRPLLPQVTALTGTLMLFSFGALFGYGLLAISAQRWLAASHRMRAFNRASGAAFVLLGLAMLRVGPAGA